MKKVGQSLSRKSLRRGFTLLFGVLVTGLLMATVMTIAAIVVRQITISGVGRESQVAFYAADSILECVKFHDRDGKFTSEADASNTLTCNGQPFTINSGETTDTFSCSISSPEYYCPELVTGVTESFRKFVYSSNQIVAGSNVPEADFVVLKRVGPQVGPNNETYADGQTTITVNGRNTDNAQSSRRVERTLQETYLPSACANPSNPVDDENNSIRVRAVRVRCNDQSYLPDTWTSWYTPGNDTTNFPWGEGTSLQADDIQDFIAGTNGNCTIDAGACFEYSLDQRDGNQASYQNQVIPGVHGADYFELPGSPVIAGNVTGPLGQTGEVVWIPFSSASGNNIGVPAWVNVKPSTGKYIAKLRVRAVLEPGQYPFSSHCDPALGPCPSVDTESSQFICHEDGNEYDGIDYLGRRIPNSPNQKQFYIPALNTEYFCAMFTAPDPAQ